MPIILKTKILLHKRFGKNLISIYLSPPAYMESQKKQVWQAKNKSGKHNKQVWQAKNKSGKLKKVLAKSKNSISTRQILPGAKAAKRIIQDAVHSICDFIDHNTHSSEFQHPLSLALCAAIHFKYTKTFIHLRGSGSRLQVLPSL